MSVPVFGEFTALDAENDVFVSRPFCGKHDTLDALRALAELPPYYSCTLERLLETVSDGGLPELLDGSFVVVTPYVNERILEFYTKMLKRGIRVAFYLTSSQGLDISAKETDAEIVFVRQD